MSTPSDTPDAWAVAASRLPLAFAQVREDPRLDLEIISLLPDHPVIVMIASGGETAIQERLRGAGVQAAAGDSSLRSLIAVQRFRHIDETACGLLEDTRCGKRLMLASGEEIKSSHLSRFR